MNRLCEMVAGLPEDIQEELHELESYFGSIEELCDHADDIIHYPDCEDMEDVARYFIEESGRLESIPVDLRDFFDYEAYGNYLDTGGSFAITNHGVFEICP